MKRIHIHFVLILFSLGTIIFLFHFNSASMEWREFNNSFRSIVQNFEYKLEEERSLGYYNGEYSISDIPFFIRYSPFRKSSSKDHVGAGPQVYEYTFSKGDQRIKCVSYNIEWRTCFIAIIPENDKSEKACDELRKLLNNEMPTIRVTVVMSAQKSQNKSAK